MKKTPIWRQWAYFVECPHCDHVESLGEELLLDNETISECEKCGKKFIATWEDK